MATVTLTARNIARLAAGTAARGEFWDDSLPGFGLRVTPNGVRTWTVRYRHNGRLHRMTLGRYPTLSLADARDLGRTALRRAGLGEHPAGDKLAARERQADTVAALVEEYEKSASAKRAWKEEKRILHSDVLPAWQSRPVSEITRRDVRDLIENKAATAPVMANRLLSHISHLFNFALDREWIESNPAHRMTPPTKEQSRDRVLSSDEVHELWTALHETEAENDRKPVARLTATMNDAFLSMLLTAQRLGEVCRMRWQDVDLEQRWWTIPGAFTKNGQDHRVPLTATVVDLLIARQKRATKESVFVFSNRKGTSVAARAKKAASELSEGLSFSFRAHDLRRTAASGMAEAGVSRDHIAHVLNHRSVTHASVTAIYDRYTYDREKLAALSTWHRRLIGITKSQGAKGRVLPMPSRRRGPLSNPD
jgi:integrase